MSQKLHLQLFLLSVALLFSCTKNADWVTRLEDEGWLVDQVEAERVFGTFFPTDADYSRKLPDFLIDMGLVVQQPDNRKAGVGRALFYDRNLSKNKSVSCASCHSPWAAFSDNVASSMGIDGKKTARNSMALGNVASFSAHYRELNGRRPMLLWDDRALTVAAQSREAFTNPVEMGMQMHEVVERVKNAPYYAYLWKKAYGHFEPTEAQVLECIEAFVGSIGSHDSKLDRALTIASASFEVPSFDSTVTTIDTLIRIVYYGSKDTVIDIVTNTSTVVFGLPGFNGSENRGRDIFIANCTKCHSPLRPFQEVFQACNGLDMDYADKGLASVTGRRGDEGVFKAPSLRNIALTAPYMHDGRFKTLREVVDFYSDGVQPHPNLHPLMMRENGNLKLNLGAQQKQDLINFLHTMTDNSTQAEARLLNPFR